MTTDYSELLRNAINLGQTNNHIINNDIHVLLKNIKYDITSNLKKLKEHKKLEYLLSLKYELKESLELEEISVLCKSLEKNDAEKSIIKKKYSKIRTLQLAY